jgi:hypothetical protein
MVVPGNVWWGGPMSGEHFIPFRKADVVSMCADELPADERDQFLALTRILGSLLHHRFSARIEALKEAYAPFNREADTRLLHEPSAAERQAARQRLETELVALAEAANFSQIDIAELNEALTEHSLLKVKMAVDLKAIDRFLVFRRGESVRTVQVPTWSGLRRRPVEFPAYARVLVYAVFKDAEQLKAEDVETRDLPYQPGSMIIKLFQNVPRPDLEMVLPNVEVRMGRLDKLLIGGTALVSGIVVIVTKLFASLLLLLGLLGTWIGLSNAHVELTRTRALTLGAGMVALGGYLWRQVTKWKNRKIQFMKALSENLYFRNLDNDAGVFHHLLDAAEEAEMKEAVLAYHFIRTAPTPPTPAELDRRIEEYFLRRWDARFDFEIEDGLRKLRELSMVSADAQERLTAVPLADARRHLDEIWDDIFDPRISSKDAPSMSDSGTTPEETRPAVTGSGGEG